MIGPDHEKNEQSKPFALAIDERDDPFSTGAKTRPTRRCIELCGCCTAILLIIVAIMLVLAFTVFNVRDPILNMNFATFEGVGAPNGTAYFRPGVNLTIVSEVSIRNPNAASFRIDNTTTSVYYNGSFIGEGKSLEGRIKARTTSRINVKIGVMVDNILEVPRFSSDLESRMMAITTYTRVNGKVKITNFVKRSVIERINCTMNVNTGSLMIQDWSCRRWVPL